MFLTKIKITSLLTTNTHWSLGYFGFLDINDNHINPLNHSDASFSYENNIFECIFSNGFIIKTDFYDTVRSSISNMLIKDYTKSKKYDFSDDEGKDHHAFLNAFNYIEIYLPNNSQIKEMYLTPWDRYGAYHSRLRDIRIELFYDSSEVRFVEYLLLTNDGTASDNSTIDDDTNLIYTKYVAADMYRPIFISTNTSSTTLIDLVEPLLYNSTFSETVDYLLIIPLEIINCTLSPPNLIGIDVSAILQLEFNNSLSGLPNFNITLDPSYIATLGTMSDVNGGFVWEGVLTRTPNMNKLGNKLDFDFSYNGVEVSANLVFDVLESADLKQYEWSQIGNNINGDSDVVAFSGNGNVYVIGILTLFRVYENNGSWTQKGDDVDVSTTVSIASKISISQDGNIIAVSNQYYNNNRGRVTIYEYNSTTGWTPKGNSINGTNNYDYLGFSLSLSSDGLIIAIGVPEAKEVQVYEFLSNSWQQKGSFLDDTTVNGSFGRSVSISSDGLIVAVGAYNCTYIYKYTSNWTLVGDVIVGYIDGGWDSPVSISGNGTRVAVGERLNNTNGSESGQVRIYDYNGTSWTQVGNSINGENAGDNCGENLALSKDGNIITVGSPLYDSSLNSNIGKLRIFQYNSSLNNWEEIGSFIENLSNSYVGRKIAISDDGSKVAYSTGSSSNAKSKIFNLNTYIERRVSAIEFPDEITDTNATDFEVKFTTNDKAFTDISGFMSVYPDNGTLVVSNLSNNGFSMVGTFTANNGIDETNNTLSYNEPNVLGNVLGEKTFSIYTITLIDEGVTFSDIIGNESSTLTIVFQIPIPTGTNLNTSVTIDPPYIAYLFGDITTSDGGTTWTGTIKRTPYMNRLSNTITVSYSGVTVNKTFDVLESVENLQLINKKWSLTNSNTINKVFTSTLQMSPNGLLMGFINGANVEIHRKSDSSNWVSDVSFVGHKFALTNNHIAIASDASLQIYDYSGNSWNIMNGGNIAYLNIIALSINVDGNVVAVSDNSVVKLFKNISNNWTHINTHIDASVNGLSLSPNGMKLGMGIGNVGEDFSSIVVEDVVVVVDTTPPVITLDGSATMTIEVGTEWLEPGYTATDNFDGNITNNVVITGIVDVSNAAVYTLYYDVSDNAGNIASQVTRTVNVVEPDTTPPVITLTGNATVNHEINTTYNDAGATANDNVDGDLTNNIVTVNDVNIAVLGSYYVTYNVADSKGNNAVEVVRLVNIVDTTNPVVTLNGDAVVSITQGDVYTELGATATDNSLESLTVVIAGDTVDTNTVGDYTVTYTATDSRGNSHQIERLVRIKAPTYTLRWTSDPPQDIFQMLGLYNKLSGQGQSTRMTAVVNDVDQYINGNYVLECNGYMNDYHYYKSFWSTNGKYVGAFWYDYGGSINHHIYGSITAITENRNPYDDSGNYRGYGTTSRGTLFHSQLSSDTNTYSGEYMLLEFPLYFEIHSFYMSSVASQNIYIFEDFCLLGSNDLITYDTIFNHNGTPNTVTNVTIDLSSNTAKYRYFKIIFTKGQNFQPHIEHIKWYGDFYTMD